MIYPKHLDFSRRRLPWIDSVRFEIEDYVRSLGLSMPDMFKLRTQLFHWMMDGYVVLEEAIPHDLIDALLADVAEVFDNHDQHSCLVHSDRYDHTPIKKADKEHFYGERMRLVDFHSASVAGKRISLHRNILNFVNHIFRQKVAMMQSLTFFEGSQQEIHQDHAYVHAKNPSFLTASWVALEDVDRKAGPLQYVPGSHAIPFFDWGNGIFRRSGSTATDAEFSAHIRSETESAGLATQEFCPKKGDVLIWHSALGHAGATVQDASLTRKSYVTHYSTAAVFKRHFRERKYKLRSKSQEVNGALVYTDPIYPEDENRLTRGESL